MISSIRFDLLVVGSILAIVWIVQSWIMWRARNWRPIQIDAREELPWAEVSRMWSYSATPNELLRLLVVVSDDLGVVLGKMRPTDQLESYRSPLHGKHFDIEERPVDKLVLRMIEVEPDLPSLKSDIDKEIEAITTLQQVIDYLSNCYCPIEPWDGKSQLRGRIPLSGNTLVQTWVSETEANSKAKLRALSLIAEDLGVSPRQLRPHDALDRQTRWIRWVLGRNDRIVIVRYRIAECARWGRVDIPLLTVGEIVNFIAKNWDKVDPPALGKSP